MSAARVGVVTFPGSLDDQDAARAVRPAGGEAVPLWHADPDLHGVDAVVLPGGFSYGDYLRCGAIARFAPVMDELIAAARAGLPVLGICNGFQILCEAHLLPGALIRNAGLHFICRDQGIRVENTATAWTCDSPTGQEIVIAGQARRGPLRRRRGDAGRAGGGRPGRLPLRRRQPQRLADDIAGIRNEAGNVVGLMPHPEHAVEDAHRRPEHGRAAPSSPRSCQCSRVNGSLSRRHRRAGRRTPRDERQPYAELGLKTTSTRGSARSSAAGPTGSELAIYSRHVERALLLQVVQGAPAPVRRQGPRVRRRCWSAWGRTPGSWTSATAGRSPSRSSRTTTRPTSSPTRARRPASAASSATSWRWAPGRSR